MTQTHVSHKMKQQAKRQFDAWAHSYDDSILHRLLFEPAYNLLIEKLYRWYGRDSQKRRLLDVGCGTGILPARIIGADLPFDVVGLDYSEPMCAKSHQKSLELDVFHRTHFVNADSEHLPFADASFDVVTCSNSFHHYPHQQATVSAMRRVLAPGGRLLLIDGFRDNVVGWFIFGVCVTLAEKSVRHVSWSETRDFFQHAGFPRVSQQKAGVTPPILLTVGELDN